MFRRLERNLPKDPSYPADFTALGYHMNDQNQIVASSGDGKSFFTYFISDNDRANEVHKEALHHVVRPIIMRQLSDLGVEQVYLNGEDFTQSKPDGPHVAILTTELDALKQKADVVVVVNESIQDVGVWAYRVLERAEGIDGGSAVGLVKKLQQCRPNKATQHSHSAIETITKIVASKLNLDDADELECADLPGVIILNPGQLLYSPQLNTTMSQRSWLTRPKQDALVDTTRIDDKYNRVPGHTKPEEHITTVFEHFLPRLVRSDVRLYLVGIGAEAEPMLKYIDSKLYEDSNAQIGGQLMSVALMQPTHDHHHLHSQAFKNFLLKNGRSFVMSDLPKRTILHVPKAIAATPHYTDKARTHKIEDSADHVAKHQHRDREGSQSSSSAPIPIPATNPRGARDSAVATSAQSNTSLNMSNASLLTSNHAAALEESDAGLLKESGSLVEQRDDLHDSICSTVSTRADLEKSVDSLDEPDPYADEEVSCPTFSAGPETGGLVEMIWPTVMDEVLADWFGYEAPQKDVVNAGLLEGDGR